MIFSLSFFVILFIYKCQASECLQKMNVELKKRKTMNIGYNVQNALQYGACEEAIIEKVFAETGYERKTTFFSDLSIAEYYGIKDVEDTIRRVVKKLVC